MGNGNVASIGEVLALAGFFSLMLGFWLLTPNTGSLCSQPPGSNVPSCPTDYSPLVLPTVIGGALIVAGRHLFFGIRPHCRPPPLRVLRLSHALRSGCALARSVHALQAWHRHA